MPQSVTTSRADKLKLGLVNIVAGLFIFQYTRLGGQLLVGIGGYMILSGILHGGERIV